jgi:hypothetical protein
MPTPTDSISSFVNKLQSPEEGYVLPSIQRPYVWKEDQVCKLFDSIMRSYPLGTLMIWRTKKDLSTRTFNKFWEKDADLSVRTELPVRAKNLVLDGQQRLQSLLIGMRGTYAKKTLYFNLLSDPRREDKSAEGDMAYVFRFFAKKPSSPAWVSVCEFSQNKEKSATRICRSIVEKDVESLKAHEDVITENIETFRQRIHDQGYLGYILIDEVSDDTNEKTEDDIVEIFVRSNNGGTKLNKSDLLFSLLSSKWKPAYEKIRKLEDDLNEAGFEFSRDYILKATLMCTGQGAAYQVKKFKKIGVLELVDESWDSISKSLKDVVSFLQSNTPISSRKSLVSANSLLPIVVMRHSMTSTQWANFDKRLAAEYMLRTSLARSFNGAKDDLLDKLAESMKLGFSLERITATLREASRNVDFDERKIWSISYKEDSLVYFALSKVVAGIDFDQISGTNLDHIIAKINLKGLSSDSINQLANLTVLSASDNKAKGKKLITEWLAEMNEGQREDYCRRNCMPNVPRLWLPENYSEFITERKKLILSQTELGKLLKKSATQAPDESEDSDTVDE